MDYKLKYFKYKQKYIKIKNQHGGDYNENFENFLKAIKSNDYNSVKSFIISDNDLLNFKDKEENTPLIYASESGNIDIVILLLVIKNIIESNIQSNTQSNIDLSLLDKCMCKIELLS